MSRFSGKSDLFAHIYMHSNSLNDRELFENFKGTKLYKYKKPEDCIEVNNMSEIKNNWEEIHYEKLEDLIPYYPYLVNITSCDNLDNSQYIVVLSSESAVDREERDKLEWDLEQTIKYYNKCKKKKIPFNKQAALKHICWFGIDKEVKQEIINRVEKDGENAIIEGLHFDMYDYYRKTLAEEMINYGLDPNDYGLGRILV